MWRCVGQPVGMTFLAEVGSAMLAEAPAANAVNAVVETAGVMDLETAAIAVNEGLATAGVMDPETVFITITAVGEESSTTSSPGRAPSPRRVLPLTPEVLGITLESFAEAEIHDLKECALTLSEVNGRIGAYMGKFAKLVKECAAAAQYLVKGFEQAPGDDARKRQVLRCAGKALSRVGDIFKEAGAEQIGPSAAPAPVVLELISPWQFCPNARRPLNEVHKCSARCTKR